MYFYFSEDGHYYIFQRCWASGLQTLPSQNIYLPDKCLLIFKVRRSHPPSVPRLLPFPLVKSLFLHSHTYLHVSLGVFVCITRMWAPPRQCSYLIHLVHPDILPWPESPSLSLQYTFTFYRHAENCWSQQQGINYWLFSRNSFLKPGGKKTGTVSITCTLMDTAFPFPSGRLDVIQSLSVTLKLQPLGFTCLLLQEAKCCLVRT